MTQPVAIRAADQTGTPEGGLRERKKRLLRKQLSDTATRLFLEHGFDAVRVVDVAEACGVSEATVFNHFPTKEALVLDRLEATMASLPAGFNSPDLAPIDAALRLLAEELRHMTAMLASQDDPLSAYAAVLRFGDLIRATPSLRAYQSDIMDQFVSVVADILAARARLSPGDPEPQDRGQVPSRSVACSSSKPAKASSCQDRAGPNPPRRNRRRSSGRPLDKHRFRLAPHTSLRAPIVQRREAVVSYASAPRACSLAWTDGSDRPPREGCIRQHTLGTQVPGNGSGALKKCRRSGSLGSLLILVQIDSGACFRREEGEASSARRGSLVLVARPASGSVRPMGKGWQARVTHLGRQVAVGTFATRREALDALATARAEIRDGRFIGPAASRVSFDSVVERWWQTREGHRPSTRARDRMVLVHDVLPNLGHAQLGEITHAEVQAWVNHLVDRLAPSSVQRSFTVLRQILDFAVDIHALSVNPSDRTRLPRRQRFEARFLTPDELERLASTIDPSSRTMVLVMAWATLRIGEAIGLRRSDLDLRTGRLRVANNIVEVSGRLHEGPPKTNAGRRAMSLPPSLVAELRLHLARFGGSRYVFTSASGCPLRAEDWRVKVWRPAVAASGLAPLRPHDYADIRVMPTFFRSSCSSGVKALYLSA